MGGIKKIHSKPTRYNHSGLEFKEVIFKRRSCIRVTTIRYLQAFHSLSNSDLIAACQGIKIFRYLSGVITMLRLNSRSKAFRTQKLISF